MLQISVHFHIIAANGLNHIEILIDVLMAKNAKLADPSPKIRIVSRDLRKLEKIKDFKDFFLRVCENILIADLIKGGQLFFVLTNEGDRVVPEMGCGSNVLRTIFRNVLCETGKTGIRDEWFIIEDPVASFFSDFVQLCVI